MLFMLHSNSVSVIWMLYFYEKDDIVLYFCPFDSQNGGDGTCYIQQLIDGNQNSARSKATAPRILISENTAVYLQVEKDIPTKLPHSQIKFGEYSQPLRFGFYPSVFRPPLS